MDIEVKIYDYPKDLVGLSKEVREDEADLGIYISDEADYEVFIDEKGNVVKDEINEALKAMILLKDARFKTFVAPVTASYSVEQVVKMFHAKFIRTKSSERNVIDEYIKNEREINRKDVLYAYLATIDAVNSLVLTMNLMSVTNKTLGEIIGIVPRYYMKKLDINCPWDKKGKVMRNLIEDNATSSVDLIEGVRLRYTDAWALVIPDSEEPLCKVYAESIYEEEAELLLNEITGDIQKIINL
jgi:mannose-1-phosphate guanylyltransferase/phosphomannomutase